MAKFLLFSDIHIHAHKKSQERLYDCLKALEWVFSVAKEHKVDAVLFGGDLLHDRQKIDTLTYVEIYNVLQKFEKESFKIYLLLGNHDLWFSSKWSVSSVKPFGAIKNIEVIEETCKKNLHGVEWHFMPYTHNPVAELEKLAPVPNQSYFLGHLALDGAKLNSAGSLSDVIIEHDGDMTVIGKDLFNNYKRGFLGHYHSAQKLTPVLEYIGSPLQLSFGEADDEKHLILLESDNDKLTYIENDFSPKHFYIKEEELGGWDKSQLENNFVCLISEQSDTHQTKKNMSKVLEDLKASSVQVKKQSKKQDEHAIADVKLLLSDQDKLLDRYVEQVQDLKLDKSKLLEIGHKIMRFEPNEEN